MKLSQTLTSWSRYFVPLLFAWVLVASLTLAWNMSMTTDEGIHVASGYLAMTRGSQRFDPEHSFLYKYLTALPLVIIHPNLPPRDQVLWNAATPTTYDSWQEAREWTDEWFYKSNNNAQEMIFLARLGGVATLLGLCFITYRLATLWFSERVGRWALFFTAFNPTLLAHGSMTNDDVAMVLGGMLALWALWLYFLKPSFKQSIWVGVSLAAAICIKFSAVYFVIAAFFWLIYVAYTKKQALSRALRHGLGTLVALWATVWVIYLGKSPLDLTPPTGKNGSVMQQVANVLTAHHLSYNTTLRVIHDILPSAFIKGMILSLGSSYFGRATFILGHGYGSGVWFYFPSLFLLKTQLIALLLGMAGIWLLLKKPIKSWKPASILLAITATIITVLSVKSKLNLGIRHISPLLVLFAIACATVLTLLRQRWKWPYFPHLIALLYILPVLTQLHNLIGFSNIFIPNKNLSYHYFNDSNLDWGQQARGIADYVNKNFPDEIIYTNYGWNPYALTYFGVSHLPFDPTGNLNGVYLVTATELNNGDYQRFQEATPYDIPDTATFIYYFRDNINQAK